MQALGLHPENEHQFSMTIPATYVKTCGIVAGAGEFFPAKHGFSFGAGVWCWTKENFMTIKPANPRDVLETLLGEVEDLRASLAVVADYSPAPPETEVAQLAKQAALKQNHDYYETIRRQIRGLAL